MKILRNLLTGNGRERRFEKRFIILLIMSQVKFLLCMHLTCIRACVVLHVLTLLFKGVLMSFRHIIAREQ
jgi:hypothetical protein